MRRPAWTVALLAGLVAAAGPSGAAAGDPTRPPAALARQEPERQAPLRLVGIWIGPSRRVAVIDGRALEEGDRVGGSRIVAIEETRVRLRPDGDRGREFELRLFGPQERRP